MNKVAVLVAFLLAGCASGPTIYMTNGDGTQVSCGSLQTAAGSGQGSVTSVAAVLANESVKSCVAKHQAAGYQIAVPTRQIPVAAYAAVGPIHDAGYNGPIKAVLIAQGSKGKFGVVRPDGVTCEGNFVTMQGAAPSGLIVKYRDVIGLSVNTSGMVTGVALGSCSNGASFQGEYYVVYNTDNGFGVATDGDGNVYKVISQ